MSEENIVKRVCKKLGITQKELIDKCKTFRKIVLDTLQEYVENELNDVKLTPHEKKELIKECEYLNKFTSNDEEKLKQQFLDHLKGKITITEQGILVNSLEDMFAPTGNEIVDNVYNIFKKEKHPQYITNEELKTVTPLFVKTFAKERKWTYKDLAESIGAGESTLKAWISKGEIPEWAKRSILLMQKIDNVQNSFDVKRIELESLKDRLKDFKNLLDEI